MNFLATPWIDQTAERMRAWPPPAGDAALEAARRARASDRHGHVLHLLAAVLFVFCCVLDQAPSSIALALLLAVGSIRAFIYPEAFTPILRWPPFWFASAWVGWSAMSHAWAPVESAPLVKCMSGQKMLLAAFMIWPVVGHARTLAWTIVFAASVNSAMQIAQAIGLATPTGIAPGRPSGFVELPVVASMWSIAAIGMAVALWSFARTPARIALAIASGLCAGGIALAASRTSVLAAIPATILLAALLVKFGHARARTVVALIGATLFAVGIAVLIPGTALLRYAAAAIGNPDHPAALSIEIRFLWWKLALEQFAAHPVIGGGLGSFAVHIADHPDSRAFAEESGVPLVHVLQAHPHNTYLRALAELGIVGFTPLACLIASMLVLGWRGARRDAIACAAFAGVMFCLLVALSECVERMNLAYALMAVLVALCAFPREIETPRS